MIDIIEITNIISNEYGKGLNTKLIFDGGIQLGGSKEREYGTIDIDTCIVLGNEKCPYEISVANNKGETLFDGRCSTKNMIIEHFAKVDLYKGMYLNQKNIFKK